MLARSFFVIVRFLRIAIKILAIVLIINFIFVSPVFSQGFTYWSEQEKIPEYYPYTEEPPFLIADMQHVVHAFNSQPLDLNDPESTKVVFYRQWTMENGWTYPNDILIDPTGADLQLVGAASDDTGQVHLIAQKKAGDIYYAQNYLANANNASLWTPLIFLAGESEACPTGC